MYVDSNLETHNNIIIIEFNIVIHIYLFNYFTYYHNNNY